MIKLIIADDDAIIREGLKIIIETQPDIEVCGVAKNGNEAIELCRNVHPDVALLDIRMPEKDGIEASEVILNENLAAPLLLTTFDEEAFILKALKLGVGGYILKNSPHERILGAIRTVSAGGTVFQADIFDYIREQFSEKSTAKSDIFKDLSQRETDVVKLIAEGLSNQEIAEKLYISNGTVRNHISTILEKTGLSQRTQIAVKYLVG